MSRSAVAMLIVVVVLYWGVFLPKVGYAVDVRIVANKNVSVSSLDEQELKQIFLGRKTQWENGRKIRFVTLDGGATHEHFLKTYVKRTPAQYSRYLKKQVFSGKARRPPSFHSEKAVIEFVAGANGAIGYVSSPFVSDRIKVISITKD